MPSTKKPTAQQEKRDLSRLRKKGLYHPKNPRAAPTNYAKQLLKKFRPVLAGEASVITVPKTKRSKGYKAAQKAAHPESGVYAVRNKLVVPKHKYETVKWDKKRQNFYYTFTSSDKKRRYKITPIGHKITKPDQIKLKEGQQLAIPFDRGRRGIEWFFLKEDGIREFWGQYKENGHYSTLGDNLFIFQSNEIR